MITLMPNNTGFQEFYITPKSDVITEVLINGVQQPYVFTIIGNKMKIEGTFTLEANKTFELIVKNNTDIVYTSIVSTWGDKILKNEFITL